MPASQVFGHKLIKCREDLSKYKQQLDAYTESRVRQMEEIHQQDDHLIKRSEDTVAQLKNKEAEYQSLKNRIHHELQREAEEKNSKVNELEKIKAEQRVLPDEVSLRKNHLYTLKQDLSKFANELEEKERNKKLLMNELTKGLSFYRERLGLEFQRIGENRLRFIFTRIDPSKEEKEFQFSVFVNAKDAYEMEECQPALSATTLQQLMKELNHSNNFSKFVLCLRRKFKETLANKTA